MTDDRRILVTGAGESAGITLVRALAERGVWTLACDVNPYAAGLYLGSARALVPGHLESGYVQALVVLCVEHGANGLISTSTEELSVLAAPENVQRFAEAGVAVWFPPKPAVDACLDRAAFALVTEEAGQPVPRTSFGNVDQALRHVPGPWIVKPRFARGRHLMHAQDTPLGVRQVWAGVPDPILQTRMPGRAFTVEALVDRSGALLGAVPRLRIGTRSGVSTAGKTFDMPGLRALVESFAASLGCHGPAHIKGVVDDNGALAFTSLVPRFSGALALALGAGADLVGQYVNGMYGQPIDRDALRHRPGTVMVRYSDEIIFDEPPIELPPVRPAYVTR